MGLGEANNREQSKSQRAKWRECNDFARRSGELNHGSCTA